MLNFTGLFAGTVVTLLICKAKVCPSAAEKLYCPICPTGVRFTLTGVFSSSVGEVLAVVVLPGALVAGTFWGSNVICIVLVTGGVVVCEYVSSVYVPPARFSRLNLAPTAVDVVNKGVVESL